MEQQSLLLLCILDLERREQILESVDPTPLPISERCWRRTNIEGRESRQKRSKRHHAFEPTLLEIFRASGVVCKTIVKLTIDTIDSVSKTNDSVAELSILLSIVFL